MTMKKVLAVLMTFVILGTALVACSKTEENKITTTEPIATEEAKIKESDALEFIKTAYTPKELGLDSTDKNYQFMVATSGVEIEGAKYVKVVANVPTKNDTTSADGKTTYSMVTLGEYYISFDGKTVLTRNMETNEYTKLENKYSDYSAKSKDADTSKAESTTAK